MVKSRLAQMDCQQKGWLLDGYPRSASQATAIEKEGIRPDLFLLIDVSAGSTLRAQICAAAAACGFHGRLARLDAAKWRKQQAAAAAGPRTRRSRSTC